MMNNVKYWLQAAMMVSLLISSGCEKEKQAADIPSIEYVDFNIDTNDELTVKIHFIDGDGDLGMTSNEAPFDCQGDDSGPCPNIDYYNLFFTYHEFEDGQWITPDPQPQIYYRFDDISPTVQNQYLEGDLTNTFLFPLNSQSASRDSIKFDIWIKDRALHSSNVVETPLILTP